MASHGCGQSSLLGSRSSFPSLLPVRWTSIFSAAFFFSPFGATFLCVRPAIKVSLCAEQRRRQ